MTVQHSGVSVDALASTVRAHARARPQSPAIAEPGFDLDYGELAARAAGLCRELTAAGVRTGGVVAAAVYALGDLAVAAVAAAELGAVLYPFDIRKAPELRAARIEMLGVDAVVLAGFPDGPWTGDRPVIHLDEVEPGQPEEIGVREPAGLPEFAFEADDQDWVARPAATQVAASVAAIAAGMKLTADDRVLLVGLPHAAPVLAGLLAGLLAGATAVAPGRAVSEGDDLLAALTARSVTVLMSAARPASLLADVAAADQATLPTLRAVLLLDDRPPARLAGLLRRAASSDLELFAVRGAIQDGAVEVRPLVEPSANGLSGPAAIEALVEEWTTVRMARVTHARDGRSVVFVETVTGVRIDGEDLLGTLRTRAQEAGIDADALPALVVTVPALPVTASGVVHRSNLAARAETLLGSVQSVPAPMPSGSDSDSDSDPQPDPAQQPDDPGPHRILTAVATALGIPGLSPQLSLFEVGATSLEIIRVISDLEADLGFEADLDELLDAPRVQTLIDQYLAGRSRPAPIPARAEAP
jgi:acyl carrier protein